MKMYEMGVVLLILVIDRTLYRFRTMLWWLNNSSKINYVTWEVEIVL